MLNFIIFKVKLWPYYRTSVKDFYVLNRFSEYIIVYKKIGFAKFNQKQISFVK